MISMPGGIGTENADVEGAYCGKTAKTLECCGFGCGGSTICGSDTGGLVVAGGGGGGGGGIDPWSLV